MARVGITEVSASTQRVNRTRAKIAQAPSDDLIVVVQVDGRCQVGQRSQDAWLDAGEGAVVSADAPYFFEFPDAFRQVVLKLPHGLIRVSSVDAFRLASGPARLLRHLALAVLEGSEDVSVVQEASVERAFIALLHSATERTSQDGARSAIASARYAEAQRYILQNLSDCELSPAEIAAHVGVSPRSLARLFALNGQTIERSIWSNRLAAAKRDLANPALRDRSITDVAFSFGFNDAAHFSRTFAAAYGISPRKFRATH